MENSRLLIYAITIVFFGLMLLFFPADLSIEGIFQAGMISKLMYAVLFLSAYLAMVTLICVTEVNILEPILLVIVSFAMSVFVLGLQYSLVVLVIILYCLRVRKTNGLLKVPNPSSSGANNIPLIFTILGAFVAVIVFFTFVPQFEPELFSAMDPFAEMMIGCSPETNMIECIEEKVMEQSDYDSVIQQCYQLPLANRQECINQVDQQFQDAIDQTLGQYTQMGDVNSTVGEFMRGMAANQVNQIAISMGPQFKLLFAFGAFSVISSVGGFVSVVVSIISSIFTFIFLKMGLIISEPRTEEVTYYLLE